MGMLIILVYNLNTMRSNSSIKISKVERDARFFPLLIALVYGIVYYWTLVENPVLRQPLQLIIFTTLMILQVALHWLVWIIVDKPRLIYGYIILQGALIFTISWMGQQLPLIFALYLAMLGETVGMLGVNRRALLAFIFYLLLAFINFQLLVDPASAVAAHSLFTHFRYFLQTAG
jgi:hypothetical protein